MATLLELASDIVSSHASTTLMSSDQLVQEIQKVHAALKALEAGQQVAAASEEAKSAITLKDAFKKNEVVCMVCGKGKMKTLARHLNMEHNMKPGQYKKQFGIPSKQSLTAKSFSEARRKMAEERGLGDVLAKARETRAAKLQSKKAPVPAVRPKSEVPVVRKKPSVPAKIQKSGAASAKSVKAKAAKDTKIPF
jgi:predicted transcriptional regulator